ncbi:hypothetical protein BSKO_04649 [Bryopsis sp. KO-2023]|nr:hypothetical protein BSKO_04649 [Bryopsis sp. KO-2023]
MKPFLTPTSARKSQAPLQLFIYDERKGNKEGHEDDKLLAYFPATTPHDDKLITVGLAQALSTFIATFDGDSDTQTLETENCWWCIRRFEPGIRVGAVSDGESGPEKIRGGSLNVLLQDIYSWIRLLHGSVNKVLQEDPSAARARISLQAVIDTWGKILTAPKSQEKKDRESPLGVSRFGATPYLPLPRDALLSVQYLANSLMEMPSVVGAMFCHELYLVWSTFSREDTRAIYSFCSNSNKLAGSKIVSIGAQLVRLSIDEVDTPVWLQPLQKGHLTAIVLLDTNLVEDPRKEVGGLLEVVGTRSDHINQSAVQQLISMEAFHISGYRYVYLDQCSEFGCASPSKKVRHLSKKTVRMLRGVQNAVGVCESIDEGCRDYEVMAKGEHGGWVVVREGGSRMLSVAMDQLPDANLEQISDHIAKLCDSHFPGAFDM